MVGCGQVQYALAVQDEYLIREEVCHKGSSVGGAVQSEGDKAVHDVRAGKKVGRDDATPVKMKCQWAG